MSSVTNHRSHLRWRLPFDTYVAQQNHVPKRSLPFGIGLVGGYWQPPQWQRISQSDEMKCNRFSNEMAIQLHCIALPKLWRWIFCSNSNMHSIALYCIFIFVQTCTLLHSTIPSKWSVFSSIIFNKIQSLQHSICCVHVGPVWCFCSLNLENVLK